MSLLTSSESGPPPPRLGEEPSGSAPCVCVWVSGRYRLRRSGLFCEDEVVVGLVQPVGQLVVDLAVLEARRRGLRGRLFPEELLGEEVSLELEVRVGLEAFEERGDDAVEQAEARACFFCDAEEAAAVREGLAAGRAGDSVERLEQLGVLDVQVLEAQVGVEQAHAGVDEGEQVRFFFGVEEPGVQQRVVAGLSVDREERGRGAGEEQEARELLGEAAFGGGCAGRGGLEQEALADGFEGAVLDEERHGLEVGHLERLDGRVEDFEEHVEDTCRQQMYGKVLCSSNWTIRSIISVGFASRKSGWSALLLAFSVAPSSSSSPSTSRHCSR